MNLFLIKEFAGQYDLDWRILYAILMTESDGDGFKNKSITKRFEPLIYAGFQKVIEGKAERHNLLPGLDPLWIRKHTLSECHLMANSLGIAQIMGYYYPYLGYKTITDLVDEWKAHEDLQLRAFFRFCLWYRSGKFLAELEAINFKQIAKMYNGAGYAKNKYDQKLIHHFNKAPK